MFQGAMTAIVTPFRDGCVDEQTFRELIDFQIESGIHGIVPCGTTGESATLTFAEHERVIEICVEQVRGRVPVVAGTGSNNTEEAIRLTAHAKRAGADGALMITPYYNKPTQEGLYRHFRKVAESVDLPIILYNVPSRTAVNMEAATIARLSLIPNIIGVKEASGTMKQSTEIISLCGSDFDLLSGEDDLTFPLLCVGGKGVISVASNVVPGDMAKLCNLCFEGKFSEARDLYYRLLPLCHSLFIETNPTPVKTALGMMGRLKNDEVRLPLAPMSAANRERLKGEMEKYGLL